MFVENWFVYRKEIEVLTCECTCHQRKEFIRLHMYKQLCFIFVIQCVYILCILWQIDHCFDVNHWPTSKTIDIKEYVLVGVQCSSLYILQWKSPT